MLRNRRHIAAAILRAVILLQCLGLLGIYYTGQNETESDIYGLLFFDLGLPEAFAQAVDDGGMLATAFCGALLAIMGWKLRRGDGPADRLGASPRRPARLASWIDCVSILLVTSWFLALALSHHWRGGPYARLALGEHAVRYFAPLALLFFIAPVGKVPCRDRWDNTATWMLRIAAAATFATHGFKAIGSYGQFVDLILLSDLRWTSWQISEQTATTALAVIGWVDLFFAAVILTRWWPPAAIYMTFWGMITALSRMTALGFEHWPSTLLRTANAGVPLALFISYFLSTVSNREKPSNAPTAITASAPTILYSFRNHLRRRQRSCGS